MSEYKKIDEIIFLEIFIKCFLKHVTDKKHLKLW